jgi:hypothetical protein
MEGKTTPPSSPEEACPHQRSARRWPVMATTGDLSQASSVTLGRDREGGSHAREEGGRRKGGSGPARHQAVMPPPEKPHHPTADARAREGADDEWSRRSRSRR